MCPGINTKEFLKVFLTDKVKQISILKYVTENIC